jgi:hypothetical protein
MKLRLALVVIIIIFVLGNGCSVYMAANQPDKKDVSVFNVGTPRTHVIAEAGIPRHTKENSDGTLTDTFVFVQGYSSEAKVGRALFHGAADVLTLGLWEVVGTPIEAIADGTEVQVQVEYDANEKVQNIIALAGSDELKGVDSKGAGKQIQQASEEANSTEEAPKLAAIPNDVPITRVSLRREPTETTNVIAITSMLEEYNFFERNKNPQGSFVNDLVDNNDGTVTDKATGLMWQKSGSLERLENSGANKYVKQLNSKHFAGYSDWRMPTIEELASLLARSRNKDVHIAPVFGYKQTRCWTVDQQGAGGRYLRAWLIDFQNGEVSQATWRRVKVIPDLGTYTKNPENYVKAVRSVK